MALFSLCALPGRLLSVKTREKLQPSRRPCNNKANYFSPTSTQHKHTHTDNTIKYCKWKSNCVYSNYIVVSLFSDWWICNWWGGGDESSVSKLHWGFRPGWEPGHAVSCGAGPWEAGPQVQGGRGHFLIAWFPQSGFSWLFSFSFSDLFCAFSAPDQTCSDPGGDPAVKEEGEASSLSISLWTSLWCPFYATATNAC